MPLPPENLLWRNNIRQSITSESKDFPAHLNLLQDINDQIVRSDIRAGSQDCAARRVAIARQQQPEHFPTTVNQHTA
jgi:hypothetical protein